MLSYPQLTKEPHNALTLERPAATDTPAGRIGRPPVRSRRGFGGDSSTSINLDLVKLWFIAYKIFNDLR